MNANLAPAADLDLAGPATLLYFGAMRNCRSVGTLKNGAGVYLIVMPSNGNRYVVRRASKSVTAKGYNVAKVLTPTDLADATFADAKVLGDAYREIIANLATLARVKLHAEKNVEAADERLARFMAAEIGEVIPQDDEPVPYGFERRESDVTLRADGRRVLTISFRHNPEHKHWNEWKGSEWNAGTTHTFSTMAVHAELIAKAEAEAADLRDRAVHFELRHAAPVVAEPVAELTGTAAEIAAVLDEPKTLGQIAELTGIKPRTIRAVVLYGKHAAAFDRAGKVGRSVLWARA
jgi:hypothetical protein